MSLTTCSVELFQNPSRFSQFLQPFQEIAHEKQQTQIVTLAIDIDVLDCLAVLQALAEPNQPHFYLENVQQRSAVVAFGSALAIDLNGGNQFKQVKRWASECLTRLIPVEPFTSEHCAPRFFGGFTFFEHSSTPHSGAAPMFLPQWQIVTEQAHSWVRANIAVPPRGNLKGLTETVCRQFRALSQLSTRRRGGDFAASAREGRTHRFTSINGDQLGGHGEFRARVRDALRAIAAHQFDKVVLADAIDVVSSLPLQWIPSLQNLRHAYPDCYVFSVGVGASASFIGASPERLLRICDRQLTTDALAGSAPRGSTPDADAGLAERLLSSPKERHEHQLVVDFMVQRLTALGLHPQLAPVPTLLRLSNIQHLHTPIQARVPATLHPLEILAELHPTPAVAGLPRDLACHHIRQAEPFERSHYAAPLGWIDALGNAEFIVGIRSALLDGNRARLYAGAGIVAGSDPDKELAEIQLKFQALLQALI